MNPSFYVYGNSSFAQALSTQLKKLGNVVLKEDSGDLPKPGGSFIFVVDPVKVSLSEKLYPHVIYILFIKGSVQGKIPNHTYYVEVGSDEKTVAEIIARIVPTFDVWKPWVFITGESTSQYEVTVPKVVIPEKENPKRALSKSQIGVTKPSPRKVSRSMPRARVSGRIIAFFVFFVVFAFFIPLFATGVAGTCGALSLNALTHGRYSQSKIFLGCSKSMSNLGVGAASTLSHLPPLFRVMSTPLSLSQFIYHASSIGEKAVPLVEAFSKNPKVETLSSFAIDLSEISRELALLAVEKNQIPVLSKSSPAFLSILDQAPLLQVASVLSTKADQVFGLGSKATYLVLLQNNMELRPTGGFIGSFLVIDVQGGSLLSYKIYDIYDADGQLKGYVRPPAPIEKYLGEASWHMRDSNWEPDFATSAQRAAWFLEKSMDIKVDGVVGVNLEVLRTIIRSVGSVSVSDYEDTLTYDNFYQTIQSEVHKEFFPGSRKKSNYLTAVVNSAMGALSSKGRESLVPLVLGLSSNLKARDIQFYSTDPFIEDSLVRANIGGVVDPKSVGFVEANVGINKSNQFIQRAGSVSIKKEGSQMTVTTQIELINNAHDQNDETRYRAYVRSIAPEGSTIQSLEVVVGTQKRAIIPEKDVIVGGITSGALVEIKGGEKGIVKAVWTLPSSNEVVFWKQGGVPSYPLTVETLTSGTSRTYNRQLVEDIHILL